MDFSSLQITESSFVGSELKEQLSDLLYSAHLKNGREAFVYILFEHKSKPDKWVAFQLLRYMMRIWETVYDASTPLPPIFPLVLYHGRTRWKVALDFAAVVDTGGADCFDRYLPRFEYHLCDLTSYTDQEIRGAATLRISLLALKYVFNADLHDRLPEIFEVLGRLRNTDASALECLRTVMEYLARARGLTADDLRPAIKRIFQDEAERIMSNFFDDAIQQGLKQGLQQGRREGLQEGLQEGLLEGLREGTQSTIIRLLKRKVGAVSARTEKRIRALAQGQLDQLEVDLLSFTSPKDLTLWLREHVGN